MSYQHGGDVTDYLLEYGTGPLDFSANVSPLGLPDGVRQAAISALAAAGSYPDPHCRALRSALADYYGLPADWILCGNGAADLIYRLAAALKPGRALITAPAFEEYRLALEGCGCATERFLLNEADGFRVKEDILDAITSQTDMLILCEPNNPTGVTTDRALLARILQRCRGCGCLLVVDECFNPFLEDSGLHSMINELPGGGLLIMRAFTKLYAMAGLRLGCCLCADAGIISGMEAAGQPWSVSSVAQAAGIAALNETEYTDALRRLIREQRPLLSAGLQSLGCRVIAGEANFLLFSSDIPELDAKLRHRGVMIRPCSNFTGLNSHWYRVSVRTERENRLLLDALREVLDNG